MIIKYHKKIGETMTELLNRFKQEYNLEQTKICFAGRLDPIAFGSIYILTENDVHLKNLYCSYDKIYEFSIIHGIKTDTFDILGLINSECQSNQEIFNKNYPYEYIQEYPNYSSKQIEINMNGKLKKVPLWYATLNNYQIDILPTKNVIIYNYDNIDSYNISKNELLELVKIRINSISKNTFRQTEILNKWNTIEDKIYIISKYRVSISSGGYIRYIANSCNSCAFDIERIDFIIKN